MPIHRFLFFLFELEKHTNLNSSLYYSSVQIFAKPVDSISSVVENKTVYI